MLGYAIGRDSGIHTDVFVTGDAISLGDTVVVDRRCYLDGRVGIEHDPDSPAFAIRGGTRDVDRYRVAVGVPAREIRDRNRALDDACRYFSWFDTDVPR